MIVVENLVKRYGDREAVRGLSFSVKKGEIVGFLGPNGAGKTTTLRILAGFLGPTSGRVQVCGHDVEAEPQAARATVGYMPETVPLYPEMRVIEYLGFRAELKGVARGKRRARVDHVLEKARVTEVANVLIAHLSKGYRQRVGLADALVADPPLLVLDEPTAGLDPNQIREVRDVIAELRGSHTVLLSTHILSEVEAICERAIVIAKGRLVAAGSITSLKAQRGARGVRARVFGPSSAVAQALGAARASLPELKREPLVTDAGDDSAMVEVLWGSQPEERTRAAITGLARAFIDAGLGVYELAPITGRLEDVFAELTETEPPPDLEARASSQPGEA